jgi:hypothetical protein
MAKKMTARKKKNSSKKKTAPKKSLSAKKKAAAKKKLAHRKKISAPQRREITNPFEPLDRRGLGSDAAGQSGDTQGLARNETADSESVEELAEEGQDFEAEVVSGVEHAKDPDQGEVTTSEVLEDDVPREYDDQDNS